MILAVRTVLLASHCMVAQSVLMSLSVHSERNWPHFAQRPFSSCRSAYYDEDPSSPTSGAWDNDVFGAAGCLENMLDKIDEYGKVMPNHQPSKQAIDAAKTWLKALQQHADHRSKGAEPMQVLYEYIMEEGRNYARSALCATDVHTTTHDKKACQCVDITYGGGLATEWRLGGLFGCDKFISLQTKIEVGHREVNAALLALRRRAAPVSHQQYIDDDDDDDDGVYEYEHDYD